MSPPRVFATCDIGRAALERLEDRGFGLEVWPRDEAPPYEAVRERVSAGVEALVTTLRDRVDAALLEAGRGSLRVVSQDAVGLDNIDVPAATERGIAVAHTPEVLTEAVAEFTLFLLGSVARALEPSERLVREGRWRGWHPWKPFLGTEVGGKTLAVVGTGRIGRAVASRAVGFDMDLLLVGTGPPEEEFRLLLDGLMERRHKGGLARERRRARWVSLDEALPLADFVTLHVPLRLPEESDRPTYHLLDREAFGRMKEGAYLVNTSRGPVVDEAALVESLRSGSLAGAALDVFEEEPLPLDSPLLEPDLRDKVRVYHHFGSGTHETRLSLDPDRGMAGRCVEAVLWILEGRKPEDLSWIVNGPALH